MENMNNDTQYPCSLKNLVLYFLKLGSIGFGGPAALVQYMESDLVDERKWISEEEYVEGFALAQLAPGPLAAQLAIYLGWVRYKNLGATLCGLVFVLPSFILCIMIAYLYMQYKSLPWIQPLFYVVGATVIGIILVSSFKLTKKAVGKDKILFTIWLVSALTTAITETENIYFFIATGLIFMVIKNPGLFKTAKNLIVVPPFLLQGMNGTADYETLWKMLIYFTKTGAVVFGSGLAIVPFLHSGVVGEYHWLTERQFLDAVAVAMISPGPVVITVAFIGYLVAGLTGASIAAIGTFLPCYLFTIIPAPYFSKYAKNPYLKSFITGITAAAIGAIAGACWVLGKRAIVDKTTFGICVLASVILYKTKIKEPLLILMAAIAGITFYYFSA